MHALLVALALAAAPAAAPDVSTIPGLAPVPGVPSLLQSGVPEVPEALRERFAQYFEARAAALLDVTEDGQAALIATRFGSTRQLHLVEKPLGMREQLTFGREPVLAARFRPGDPRTVLYLQDQGGAEQYQLLRLDRRTGRAVKLTTEGRHETFAVSPDGKRVAFSGTERNGKDTDVYVLELDGGAPARRVVEGEGTAVPIDFSPDSSRLLVRRERSIADADLLLVDAAGGEPRVLTPREGKASVRAARFAHDGKSVYLVTDRYSEWNELYALDLGRPEAPPRPLSRTIPWDVEEVAVARDGSRVAFTVNAGGASALWLLDLKRNVPRQAQVGTGVIGELRFPARDARLLFFDVQTPRSPVDVWQLDLGSTRLDRWTRSEVGGLDAQSFVNARAVSYPSKGGVTVPAFLWEPPAHFEGKRPVVILWHGGPEGQSRPVFSPFFQLLASELGFAVLTPNVRGSDGHGKAFLAMDDGPRREEALADIGATLDWIATQPRLDAGRVGVYGGSYGGYMVLATLAFHPGRVRAGVDVVGISSLPTFLQNTQPYRRDLRRAEYGDERDPAVRAVQERISPLGSADRITAALYVQQGKNDPRVPQSEAEQIVRAVRARGGEAWYLLALDEGHGFAKKDNRDFAVLSAVMFLERALGR